MIDSWLIRTPQGWAEPTPPTCVCGSDRYLIGWQACQCRAGPFTGGHRTWECRGCGARTLVGCVGRAGAGPMEEYGVRARVAVMKVASDLVPARRRKNREDEPQA